jgi:integrase
VVGLQKYNKQNNIDDEKKAHPVSVHELSIIMNAFSALHPFVGAMYRFMFSAAYLGCFRMGEVLNLTWDDVSIHNDEKGKYVSVRLRWHKKAHVESACQIYHLVDEIAFPCLKVCAWIKSKFAFPVTLYQALVYQQ